MDNIEAKMIVAAVLVVGSNLCEVIRDKGSTNINSMITEYKNVLNCLTDGKSDS